MKKSKKSRKQERKNLIKEQQQKASKSNKSILMRLFRSLKRFSLTLISSIALIAETLSDSATTLLAIDIKYYIAAIVFINVVLALKKEYKNDKDDESDK